MWSRLSLLSNRATTPRTAFAFGSHLSSRSLRLIQILHHDFSHSFISLLSLLWLFFFLLSPSISTSAKFDITFSSPPSTAMGWLAEHPLNSACKLSRIPPFWVLILDVCLSVSVSEKQVALSVNKCLIFRLLVPVCLSVCLTCRQLSRRSRVAVSQVLVSVLLSVHLPVKASQIRHVNLPPGFPLLQDGFIKNK